jgi:hypothetical protein
MKILFRHIFMKKISRQKLDDNLFRSGIQIFWKVETLDGRRHVQPQLGQFGYEKYIFYCYKYTEIRMLLKPTILNILIPYSFWVSEEH